MKSGRYTNPFSSPYLSSKEVFCFLSNPFDPNNSNLVGINISCLEVRKLRLRERKSCVQGHTTGGWTLCCLASGDVFQTCNIPGRPGSTLTQMHACIHIHHISS